MRRVIIFAACLSVGVTPLFRLAPYLRMMLIVSEVDEIYSAAEAVVYVMPNFLGRAVVRWSSPPPRPRLCPITLTAQVVGILIVKEGLIVAFIVDAFLSQFEDNRALCEDENIASLDQSRAGEGFRIIASKRSSKDDIYRAMFLEDDD